MSVIDSRRYGRRSTTSFTREEFERIKNTPPPDLEKLHAEAERLMVEVRKAIDRRTEMEQKNASASE